MRRTLLIAMCGLFLLSATQADGQIFHKKKKVNKATTADNSAEPDKVLYDRAMDDIKHGRHEVGRLNLQTLINTYPDSDYLAKAKLAIADSFYREGGTANLTQAVQGYKDFIVFFPFLPEATYAQMQVAMTHYRQMEKPDRDRTEARAAEEEFQTFLSKYPKDPLAGKVEQYLRNVQEVLAEGDYRIGYYYYVKGDKRAAAARLIAVTNRYPLYSKADQSLWIVGNIFATSEHKEIAAFYYQRILKNYPLSSLAPNAKSELTAMKVPIPQADPNSLAWMKAEQNAPREKTALYKKPMALFHPGPSSEFITAARGGMPQMAPESDNTSATDVLTAPKPGGPGNSLVATVPVGGTSVPASGSAENVAGSDTTSTTTEAPVSDTPPAGAAPHATSEESTSGNNATATPPPAAGDATAKSDGTTAPSTDASAKADGTATTTPTTDATTASPCTQQQSGATDGKGCQESTSKKKKGLKKLIPW